MSGKKVSSSECRVNTVLMKNRIKELEDEVASLKRRLDELRKAKNTTVLKREREVINVSGPNLGRRESSGSHQEDDKLKSQLEKKLKEKDSQHEIELEAIQNKLHELTANHIEQDTSCGHESILTEYEARIRLLEGDNAALLVENKDLKEKVDSLYTELSIKEANTVEIEQKTEAKLKIKWQEMYAEWMQKTNARLQELNQANAMLQAMLRRHDPNRDSDSSGTA